ncbi:MULTISPECIES: hypothetical protein [unclassified Mycobacterium]|uniref:hypothetical protein n=1 Tax=unclassified Mycobacterium TaxID=2642494 RepID=UPI000F920469|nr:MULTISPECIES: hypothetical protein [unclassified Mycobacterium]MDP7705906.1 hypothetical protein [Mycobacterium sp. TY815]MDP7725380.1 hypothetical protein [Mycobacterium sp. TY814]RUP04572.1 MAG: hypothetical protein EKK34_13965 [Mycobacterium sp.]
MAKLDITTQIRGIDDFLATLDNPRHRQIIENYRRHAIFEITGNKDKIFTPDMTVEEPVYYVNGNSISLTLNGFDEVYAFYTSLQEQESTVMVVENEKLAVADWGFASEAIFNRFMPGSMVPDFVDSSADPGKFYIHRQLIAMIWPYDERGRLAGEHVYEHAHSSQLIEIPADEYITIEEAREKLLPLQRALPVFEPAC